ncbi:MAG: 3-hydroxy-5-phosphonooxypentane-2,4-dione thiolase [Candidatus Zapsychrus exili]|nr:3-hydroxy-5-phosphonooxypentane-2,4-dione thiolase [Candidatus Zapsychrus exili]
MDWGMENRLARIIKKDTGKALMLAVDHGYFLGPTSGLENISKTIKPLLPYTDSLMLTRGALRNCVDPSIDTPIVMRASGGNSVLDEDLSNEDITVSIEDAIRMNVSALALSIFVGSEYQHRTIVNLAKLVDKGQKYGIPILAVTAVGKEMVRDLRYLGLACRIAAETGAHIVKTYYCKGFQKLVKQTPIPVVIAGGKKIPELDALNLAYNAINDGAVGVDMGRNIFQSDAPVPMIKAVRSIIHEGSSVKNAYNMYSDLKKKKIGKAGK